MIGIGLIFFVLLIGLFGLAAHFLFFRDDSEKETPILECFTLNLLSGVAILSVLLLIAAFSGFFFKWLILSTLPVLLFFCWLKWRKRSAASSFRVARYLIFCLCVGLASIALATFTKPYQALIHSQDASVYTAAAFQLVNSGAMHYSDPLVLEMTRQERSVLFSRVSRFSGGVNFYNREKGTVIFGFLPLFPVWLAFAITFLGADGFLFLLNFFTVVGILLLYLIGKKISGSLLGVSTALVLFFFFPQFYFSRLPLSESCGQMLFLSGLFTFVAGDSRGHQRLTGLLWGSMLLCRIELVFFLLISLILLFTVHPRYRCKWHNYRVLLLIVSGFALSLFCWQLATGAYLKIWGVSHRLMFRLFWLPAVEFLHHFVRIQRVLGLFTLLGISAAILVLLNILLRKEIKSRYHKGIRIAGILLGALLALSVAGHTFNWSQLLAHLNWALVYIPDFCLIVFFTGYIFLFFKQVRQPNHDHLLLTLLIWFLPPLIFFLNRPLTAYQQPLFVRRFVPIVFPLCFLLSFAGWYRFLQLTIRHYYAGRLVFVLLVLAVAGMFYADTAYLIRTPLFKNVVGQIDKLSAHLPAGVLVLIPPREAGHHMGLPLQYMAGRETFCIPWKPSDLFDSFLKRQISKNRPVYLLTIRAPDVSASLLPSYRIDHEFSEKLSFYTLPPGKADKITVKARNKVLQYYGYRVVGARGETDSSVGADKPGDSSGKNDFEETRSGG
jgi:hypothetical protein